MDRAFRSVSVPKPLPTSRLLPGRSLTGCAKRMECMTDILLSPAEVGRLTNDIEQIHARLGEILYISAMSSSNETADSKTFAEAMRRFCRSVELCDDYLRGYYGLKLVLPSLPAHVTHKTKYVAQTTDRLLSALPDDSKSTGQMVSTDNGELPMPSTTTVRKLNERATFKLAEITRDATGKGLNHAEVVAAKALLDKSTQIRQR